MGIYLNVSKQPMACKALGGSGSWFKNSLWVEINITCFGYGRAYMTLFYYEVFFTFNYYINFNIRNKIVKKFAFSMKTLHFWRTIFSKNKTAINRSICFKLVGSEHSTLQRTQESPTIWEHECPRAPPGPTDAPCDSSRWQSSGKDQQTGKGMRGCGLKALNLAWI